MRNTDTPSTTTEPPRVTVIDSRDHTTSATNAPTRVSVVSQTCTGCRRRRGAKASTTTPTSAPSATMSIGAMAA